MARDLEWFRVDTNWHTTSNTNFHHEKQRDYDLDYHWISLAATFLEHLEDCIHSHHLSSTMRPMDFGRSAALRDNDFGTFRRGSVFQEKPGSTFPVPERCWGPRCREEVLPTPTCILWLWNLVIGNPALQLTFLFSTLVFHGQATQLIGGCTCQKLDYRWS